MQLLNIVGKVLPFLSSSLRAEGKNCRFFLPRETQKGERLRSPFHFPIARRSKKRPLIASRRGAGLSNARLSSAGPSNAERRFDAFQTLAAEAASDCLGL